MNIRMRKTGEGFNGSSNTARKVKNDLVLISVILLLVSAAALMLFLLRTPGDTVVVTVDGKVWGEYPLSEDRTVEIRQGEGYNLLIIADGTAYVQHASCPDGICSSHRPVCKNGESIICLPNKVVIEIHAKSKDRPDVIV